MIEVKVEKSLYDLPNGEDHVLKSVYVALHDKDVEAFEQLIEEVDHYPIAIKIRGLLND